MCEFSEKLVAWLDSELLAEESAEVQRHLETCATCRARVDDCKRVSAAVNAYCEETLASSARREGNPWTAVGAAAGAAATLAAVFLIWPRAQNHPPAVQLSRQVPVSAPATTESALLSSLRVSPAVRRRPATLAAQARPKNVEPAASAVQNTSFTPQEPVIQISIPADEMFPPGAVPQGMHFIADVTISPDGSAERMRLRPRLAGFERSTVEP